MNAGPAQVDLALTAVRDAGSEVRLVLRRSVCARADDGRAVSVEELWVSRPCPSPFAAAETLQDVLCHCGPDLVRGRPVAALPGLASPSTAELVALHRAVEGRTVGVEYLAGYRGTVQGLCSGRPELRAGDVVATDGFLGVRTRRLLVDVLRGLGLPGLPSPGPAGAPALTGPSLNGPSLNGQALNGQALNGQALNGQAPTGPALDEDVVRANLLRDLAGARLRLDQERRWALRAAARLEFVYGRAPAPGWSRAVRRGPDGATVEPGEAPRRAQDAVVAVFVDARDGRVNLFRYMIDMAVDVPGVLADPLVQDAFAAYAADPGDSLAQARAVAALRGARPGDGTDRAPDPGASAPGPLVAAAEALDGVVVLHDRHEVEAGNDVRRFDTVAYLFTPAATTGERLRSRADIVAAIVDRSCAVDDSGGGCLRTALAAAVLTGERHS